MRGRIWVTCTVRVETGALRPYAPKLIATRKGFQDKALESRCLTEVMDFVPRSNVPPILPDSFWAEAQAIRNYLLQWRFDKYRSVTLRPDRIQEGIEARLNQVLMPLASMIEDERMVDDLRQFAERYNKNLIVERGALLEAEVLQTIVDMGNEGISRPSMGEIAARFNADRPDSEPVTAHRLGRIVGDKLRLQKEPDQRKTYRLRWDWGKISKFCERYGVVIDPAGLAGLRGLPYGCSPENPGR